MNLVPFDYEAEMVAIDVRPGFFGSPSRTVWNAPLSGADNIREAFKTGQMQYLPNYGDTKLVMSRVYPDNMARGCVFDGLEPYVPDPEGVEDAFGVVWVYEPEVGGSMEKPGVPPMLSDIDDWREVIVFRDPDEWSWAEAAESSKEYRSDPNFVIKSTIFTGYFERLISWMGFEDAIISLFDEDYTESVHEVFEELTQYYIKIIKHLKESFDIEVLEFHDDWGSQSAPLFSEDVHRRMILPYIKRLVDCAHELGIYFEMHSCGNIGVFVPLMIEAGIDTWMGQDCNDKKKLFDLYGDKIILQVEVPELGQDVSDEEVWAAAQSFCDDFVVQGKPCLMGIYSNGRDNRPLLQDAIYQISRKMLCGVKE